jgi:hypothetical protein
MALNIILLLVFSTLCCFSTSELIFDGQYLTVATGQPNLATLLRSRAEAWKNETGATVIVQTRDFGTFFDDVKTDLLQNSPFFDAYAI